MILQYDPNELDLPWYASTDSGDYDASGKTSEDAMAGLIAVLEIALEEEK